MNYSVLTSVVSELAHILVNARVERVYEKEAGDIVMVLRHHGHNYFLLVSPDRSLPRMHLLAKKPAAAPSLHPFTLFLKSRIAGAVVTGICLVNHDRIVEVRFKQNLETVFLFELTGSRSNLFIMDNAGIIQMMYSRAGTRALGTGMPYVPPLRKAAPDTMEKESACPVAQSHPGLVRANRDAESFYENLLVQKRIMSVRGQLQAAVAQFLKKAVRRGEAIDQDEKAAHSAEDMKKTGDLILSNLKKIGHGATEIELEGYDGHPVRVVLDPKRSASGNADQYFKKYKKLKAGREIMAARLREARKEAAFLRNLQEELAQATTEAALTGIGSALEDRGYGRPKPGQVRRTGQLHKTAPETASYRRVHFHGWEIIVGKSAAGNDHITFYLAGPDDLWLHAEGIPGSHVVVRNPGSREIGEEILLKAAALAAFYSKGRSAGKVPVTYTFAKHVKKPRGAKPGLVSLLQRRTIMAVPEQE